MPEYELYAALLTLLNVLAAFADGALSLASKRQLDQMITTLDELGLRVTWHQDTQSYTVAEMPKG